jgi:hypothetical protein
VTLLANGPNGEEAALVVGTLSNSRSFLEYVLTKNRCHDLERHHRCCRRNANSVGAVHGLTRVQLIVCRYSRRLVSAFAHCVFTGSQHGAYSSCFFFSKKKKGKLLYLENTTLLSFRRTTHQVPRMGQISSCRLRYLPFNFGSIKGAIVTCSSICRSRSVPVPCSLNLTLT